MTSVQENAVRRIVAELCRHCERDSSSRHNCSLCQMNELFYGIALWSDGCDPVEAALRAHGMVTNEITAANEKYDRGERFSVEGAGK